MSAPLPSIGPEWAISAGLSIIPLGPDKRPIIPSWKPYQTRCPNSDEIASWKKLHPAAWGLITGALSGRIALDFDGKAGAATLRKLGIEPHRGTPSGGFHADFVHPGWHVPTLNSKTKRDLGAKWPGLDQRGDGGYVAFCGHTKKGEYVWLRDPAPYDLDVLPPELRGCLGLLNRPAPEQAGGNGRSRLAQAGSRVGTERLIRMALDRTGTEGRNNAGFWLAGQLRDNGYDKAEAAVGMREFRAGVGATNTKGQREPYTESEMLASLDQVYNRPARQPWEQTGGGPRRSSVEEPRESPRQDSPAKDYPVRIAPGFTVDEEGVFKVVEGDDPKLICAPLHVIAYARTAEREEWRKLLRFKDFEKVSHEWLLPLSLLARDTAEFRSKLLGLGLRISASKGAPELLRQYLQLTDPETFALTVDRIGWNEETFVLPDENIGPPNSKMIVFQPPWEMSHRLRTAGTLDQWRDQVGRYCSKNSRLLFCVSCAAAAPLLYFFGEQSGGFHLVADTTVGKTTCLMVAGSFWGGGGQNGFVQSWLTTANALENTAEWHNNVLLCLDELKLIDPEQASKVAYSLSNGQSKGRAGRDMRAHRRVEWQLLFLSTGELGLASHLQAVTTQKQRLYGGQEVRFCEIPARVDDNGGAFEFAHGFEGPNAFKNFSEHLKAASRNYYGSACRDYLQQVAHMGYDRVRSVVQQYQKRFSEQFIPPGLAAEAARAGARFSLVGAGGELATALGITGWEPGEALAAAGKCFKAWREQRGSNGTWDENQALKHVESMLIATGNSRFQFFMEGVNRDETIKVPNRIGVRTVAKDGDTEYLVLPAMFHELCSPHPEDLVRRTLQKRGFLKGSDADHATVKRTLPEFSGRPRCYVISGRICSSDE